MTQQLIEAAPGTTEENPQDKTPTTPSPDRVNPALMATVPTRQQVRVIVGAAYRGNQAALMRLYRLMGGAADTPNQPFVKHVLALGYGDWAAILYMETWHKLNGNLPFRVVEPPKEKPAATKAIETDEAPKRQRLRNAKTMVVPREAHQ